MASSFNDQTSAQSGLSPFKALWNGLRPQEGPDEADTALGPLERLQRKWGIGDRKTRDGQPAKRRGPKPDSKPALTRRQELNRQAQRTHRERKENYMRELEITVNRLRKLYREDVDLVREENKQLKGILAAHGIQYELNSPTARSVTSATGGSAFGASPTGPTTTTSSSSAGFPSASPKLSLATVAAQQSPSFPLGSPTAMQSHHHSGMMNASPTGLTIQVPRNNFQGLDYDEIGLDFVGTLEEFCMQHKQFMVHKSLHDESWVCGHALMATVPPREFVAKHGMDKLYPHRFFLDDSKPDLARMLALCAHLPGLDRDGEVTPVMAWAHVLKHPRCGEFSREDIELIRDELKPKVLCYGFGAVLEDYEVEDAILRVVEAK